MTPKAPHQSWGWFTLFRAIDKILRVIEPLFPKKLRQRAIDAALAFTEERLNGEDGMGAIYPPMANIVMMYEALGKGPDFPPRAITRRGIDKLLVIGEHEAYCQPCVSPVWDTALTCHALAEAGGEETLAKMKQGLDWLKPRQVLDLKGDWAAKAPDVRPGGWAFQYNNAYYPDLDDTAVVVMAMDRARRAIRQQGIRRRRSPAAASGSRACRAATAAGRPSTSTTSNTTSTTSRSPTTARCSIRRPRTSPRAASRCWRSSARPPRPARRWPTGSPICAAPSSPRARGTAAGA